MRERFSNELVVGAKKAFWHLCGGALEVAALPFQIHRDSDKRSQLVANLDDISKASDIRDSTDSIPAIFYEASDLPCPH